jgi:16S rRNA (adenine(1408)-N(1))-methyltransferase
METIRGKSSFEMDRIELNERFAGYNRIHLDLGTGDGRFVRRLAERHPYRFVIGLDAARENLREHSRAKLPNMLFVIANAHSLPSELAGRISHLTINFPWGSLLQGLLHADPALMAGLAAVSRPAASLDVRLNSGALAEAGVTLEAGAAQIQGNLLRSGWQVDAPGLMDAPALRDFPSTWARRLAVGRDPRAAAMSGMLACR